MTVTPYFNFYLFLILVASSGLYWDHHTHLYEVVKPQISYMQLVKLRLLGLHIEVGQQMCLAINDCFASRRWLRQAPLLRRFEVENDFLKEIMQWSENVRSVFFNSVIEKGLTRWMWSRIDVLTIPLIVLFHVSKLLTKNTYNNTYNNTYCE